MSHIQFINVQSEEYYRDWMRRVSRWEYPVKGPLRKGHYRPYVAEYHVNDIRIPKCLAAQLCVDLELQMCSNKESFNDAIFSGRRLIKFMLLMFRWLTPWKEVNTKGLTVQRNVPMWKQAYLIGEIKDPYQRCLINGKYKEVL